MLEKLAMQAKHVARKMLNIFFILIPQLKQ